MTMEKVKILVACASSVAQATMLQMALSEFLQEKKIPFEIQKCQFSELKQKVSTFNPDFLFTAGFIPDGLPSHLVVFNGLSLITGFGKSQLLEEFYEKVKEFKR